MKPNHARRNRQGVTFIEILICLVVLAVLAGMLLPALSKTKRRRGNACFSNLKQVGLALRIWSNDNGGSRFPWEVSTNNGGTKELISSGDVFPHFLAISNEANTPKIFVCNIDSARTRVTTWDQFVSDTNLSYFVGLDASEVYPQTILSGDRNLSTSSKLLSGLVLLMTNAPFQWATGLHAPSGNLGLGDGSVQPMTGKTALAQRAKDTNPAIRVVFP